MPRAIKRILGNVIFFLTFLLKFKTRKHHNALFASTQAQHTSTVQPYLFAYSLADSVQNNLGIVTDVIRNMIKQALFFIATFTLIPVAATPITTAGFSSLSLNVYCKEKLLMIIFMDSSNEYM